MYVKEIFLSSFVAESKLDGDLFWNPLQLIDHWDNRAATFFAAFSFALATMRVIYSTILDGSLMVLNVTGAQIYQRYACF